MARNVYDACSVVLRDERAPDSPSGVEPTSALNPGFQTTVDASPLWALTCRLIEPREFATSDALAYVLGTAMGGGGLRCRLLVLSRSGRYIHIWQPRKRLAKYELVKVLPDMVSYGHLRLYLSKPGIIPTEQGSLEAVKILVEILGIDTAPASE